VNVRILGPPAVHVAGAWLPLRPTKPHALLAYVAYRDAPVRRAEMATLMWPDADAEHAQCDVRQALRNLARGPFAAAIGRDRTGVWLCGECDVHAFRAAVAEGRWSDAFALHGGPLLQGFEIDDADEFAAWLASERSAVAGIGGACVAPWGGRRPGPGATTTRSATPTCSSRPIPSTSGPCARRWRPRWRQATGSAPRGASRSSPPASRPSSAWHRSRRPGPSTSAAGRRSPCRSPTARPMRSPRPRLVGTVFAPYGATAAPRAPPRRFPYPAVLGREREIAELAGACSERRSA
jgi:hypothetical protein